MVQRLAEGRFHAFFQCQIQRAGTGVDVAERRILGPLDAALLQVGQQAREQRGRALQLRHAMMGQRIEQVVRVELRAHDELGTRQQRADQHRAQPEDVGHGHEGVAAVLWAQRARGAGNAREVDQRVVREHHALGLTGGAGGEDERRHRVAQRARFGLRIRAHGAVLHARQGRVHRGEALCMRGGAAGRCGREKHHARVGLGGEGVDLGGRHARIHAAGPGTHAAAGQDQRGMLRAILGHDQHAIAGAHLQRTQFVLGGVGKRTQVGKAQVAAIGQVNEWPLRCLGQPAVQQVVDAFSHEAGLNRPRCPGSPWPTWRAPWRRARPVSGGCLSIRRSPVP